MYIRKIMVIKELRRINMRKASWTLINILRGAWVSQLFECLTLDFGSGGELRVVVSSPTQHGACLGSLFLSLFSSLVLSLSLSKLKEKYFEVPDVVSSALADLRNVF